MAKNVEASVTLRADIRDLTKTLATVPGITEGEAKRMAIALEKQIKKAEAAAKDAAKNSAAAMAKFKTATDNAADATKELGSRAGDTESGLRALGGVLGLVSPEAEKAVGTIAEFGGGLEGATRLSSTFGISLRSVLAVAGPLAVAIGALVVANEMLARETENAVAIQRTQREVNERLRSTERAIVDARLDLAEATGDLTAAELRRTKASLAAQRAVLEFASAQKEQRAELVKSRDDAQSWLDTFERIDFSIGGVTTSVVDSLFGWSDTIETTTTQIDTLDRAVEKEAELQKQLKDILDETADKQDRQRDSARGQSDAARDAAEAVREWARAYEEAQRDRAAALDELTSIRESALASVMSEEERLTSEYDAQIKRIAELEAATYDLQAAESARAAIAIKHEDEIAALRAQQAEDERRRQEQALADQARLAQEQIRNVQQVGSYIQQGVGMLASSLDESYQTAADTADRLQAQLIAGEDYYTAAQKKALQSRIEAQRDAAEKAWRASKNAKVAEATAATALAAINAIAQSPPPSPFGLIGAGIATAAGAASIAAINSQNPTFHRGGSPDEMPATLTRGEYVSSPVGRSVLGDDALRRADAGIAPQPVVYAVSQYRHDRIVTRWKRDGLNAGDPIEKRIKSASGRITGH